MASTSARATVFTWLGNGANGTWSTSGNFSSPTPFGASDDLQFAGNNYLTTNNHDSAAGNTINSLTFNAGAGAFTLNGVVGLTLEGGGITNLSSNLQTISFAQVTTAQTQTWNAGAAGFNITSPVQLDLSGGSVLLTVTGAANTTISGDISQLVGPPGTEGSLLKTGSGTLTLTGNNSYSGDTTINAGTLVVTGGGSINQPTGSLIVGSGSGDNASFQLNGGFVQESVASIGSGGGIGDATISSGTLSSATLNVGFGSSSTGALTIDGGLVNSAAATVANGVGSFGSVTITSGTWQNSGQILFGFSQSGTLAMSGGLFSSDTTYLGMAVGAQGLAMISGGTFQNNLLILGVSGGTGVITLDGGLVNSGASELGNAPGSSGTFTVESGTFANTGTLTLGELGSGVLNLTGGTTSAATVILASGSSSVGTINIGTGSTAGTLNTAIISTGSGVGTVNFNHIDTTTLAANLTGSLTVHQLGSGTTILTGNNSYSGTTTISAGTLQIGVSGTTGSLGSGAVVDNGTLNFDRTDSGFTVSNQISGSGAVIISGTGLGPKTILTGSNSYSGGTVLRNGGAVADSFSAFGTGTVTVNGNGSTVGVENGVNVANIIDFETSSTTTLTNFTSNASGTFSGNVFLHGTTLNIRATSGTGSLTLSGITSGTGNIILQNGTGVSDTTSLLLSGIVNNVGTITSSGSSSRDTIINSVIGSNVTGLIQSSTASRLVLEGGNAYTGSTHIASGTLALSGGGSIASSSVVNIDSAGDFDISGVSGAGTTIDDLAGSGTITLGSKILTLGTADSGTYAGSINGAGGLTKQGTGALTLSGSSSFTGTTTVNNGTVIVAGNNALGPLPGSLQPYNVVVDGSASTLVVNAGITLQKYIDVEDSGTVNNQGTIDSGAGVFSRNGGMNVLNTGTITANTGDISDDTAVSAQGNSLNFLTNTGGLISSDGEAVDFISGGSVLNQSGGRLLTDDTTVIITSGTMAALTNTGTSMILGNQGVVFASGNIMNSDHSLISGTEFDGIDVEVGNVEVISSTVTNTGTSTINGDEVGVAVANSNIERSNSVVINSLGSVISATTADGEDGVQMTGGFGKVMNDATSTIAGRQIGVDMEDGGSVTNNGLITGSLAAGSGNTGVKFAGASGTLVNTGTIHGGVVMGNFANSVTLNIGSLISGGLNVGTTTTSKLILDGTSGSQLFSSAVTGSTAFKGILIKQGSGTWTLDRAMNYTGTTGVQAGELLVDTSLTGTGAVGVLSGATLGGTGTIGGRVTVQNNGILDADSLRVGGLVLSATSQVNFDLQGVGLANDEITVGNGLTLDGVFNFATGTAFGTGTYNLIAYSGTLTNNNVVFGAAPAGFNLTLSATSGLVRLTADYTGLQYWNDSQMTPDNTVHGGSGTWNSANTNWTDQAGNATGTWANLTAVFSATGGTVSVAGHETVAGLQFSADGYNLTDGGGSIAGSGTDLEVRIDPGDTATIGAKITGSSTLLKTGSGTIVLAGPNDYTGGTELDAGTLRFGSSQALGTGTLAINAGTIGNSGANTQVGVDNAIVANSDFGIDVLGGSGELTLGGAVALGSGTRTITFSGNGSTVFSGDISGENLALASTGSTAQVSFTGSEDNTFTGTLEVGDHVQLLLDKSSATAVPHDLVIDGGGEVDLDANNQIASTSDVVLNGSLNSVFTTNVEINDLSGTGVFVGGLTSSGTLTVHSGSFGGVIVDTTDPLTLTKTGTGTLTLAGTNQYSGETIVNGGTLAFIGGGSEVGTSAVAVDDAGTLAIVGGSLSSGTSVIGFSAGSSAKAEVSSGTWTTASDLVIGGSGSGLLVVDGGFVSSATTVIGLHAGGSGTAQVSSGTFAAGRDFIVGGTGAGALSIMGGVVSDTDAVIGGVAGSSGTAEVSGGSWTSSVGLVVGGSGTGGLTIDGGSVSSLAGVIGHLAGSSGTAAVTSGTWHNGTLVVGDIGTGALTLSHSGVVMINAGSGTMSLGRDGGTGTLQIGDGGTFTGTLAAAVVTTGSGSGTVIFDQANTYTFAPKLSGALSLQQSGAGTTIITSANTYTGGTVINAGTVQTTNASALGTGNVTLNGGLLAPSGTLTIAGIEWNAGALAMALGSSGSSEFDITGDATNGGAGGQFVFTATTGFAANTTYTLWTLDGTTNFVLADFTGNGLMGLDPTFFLSGSDLEVRFDGAISGKILSNGPPTSTPTNADFTVSGSAQTSNAPNIVNSLTFDPGSNLTVFDRLNITSGNFTVNSGSATIGGSGVVTTPGDFTKLGGGILNLLTSLFVHGDAFIQNGKLAVNGSLTAQDIFVELNAWLKGDGVIFGSVFNHGTVAPGNSPGTLTVNGNYTQFNNGTLQIEAASTSNFDHLIVSGQANLGGTLEAASYNNFKFKYGQQFAFLQAGKISGNFDSVTMPDPSQFRGRFVVDGHTGSLVVAPTRYEFVAQNQNQTNVAHALDRFIPATSGDKMVVSTALDLQTSSQYANAFDQISPAFYESLPSIAIEQVNAQNQMLAQRLSAARFGTPGFTVIGLDRAAMAYDKDGKSVMDAKSSKDIISPTANPNWGVWVQGNGIFSKVTDVSALSNYRSESGGFLTGVDYRWNENFITGVYGGYQYSYSKYANGGSNQINGAIFGGYATYHSGGLYSDAIVGGGYNDYTAHRSIQFSTVDRTANSQPNGGVFNSYLDLGYDWNVSNFTFGPIVSGQYTYAGVSPFTEDGADSLDLKVGQQNDNSLQTSLGGRIAYQWKVDDQLTIVPEVRMFWQHEYLQNPYNISSSLDGGSGSGFNFSTSAPDRDAVFAGAGFTAEFGPNWNAYIFYNADFGRSDYMSSVISTGLTWKF